MKLNLKLATALAFSGVAIVAAILGSSSRSEAVDCLEPLPIYATTCTGVPNQGATIKLIQVNQPVETHTTDSSGNALFHYVRPAAAQVIQLQYKKSNELTWHTLDITVTPNGAGCGDPVVIDPGTGQPCTSYYSNGTLNLRW